MREENRQRLVKYVDKNTAPFSGVVNAIKEVENMRNAKIGGKAWTEKNNKRGFYPHHPAIKSVERKTKSINKAINKKKQ